MLKGSLVWSHWEQGSEGPLAVFRLDVPKESSHFAVNYCCVWNSLNEVSMQADGRTNAKAVSYHDTPGYRGELFINPVTGEIQRITIEAKLGSSDLITRAAISLQYGKVDIGGAHIPARFAVFLSPRTRIVPERVRAIRC